jgi:SecD/SecF fusion protein
LPGVKDPQRVRDLLQGTANLEFWETYENAEVIGYLMQANDFLRSVMPATALWLTLLPCQVAALQECCARDTAAAGDKSLLDMVSSDTSAAAEASSLEEFTRQNPLFGLLRPNVSPEGQPEQSSIVGFAAGKDTARVNDYLAMNQIKSLFPRELKFYWSQNAIQVGPDKYPLRASCHKDYNT